MKRSVIFVLLIVVLAGGCATIYNPATQRNEFIFISTPQEVSLGKNLAKQIEQELVISDNRTLQQKVQTIGGAVAKVSHRNDLAYHFRVVKDDEVNAFAMPGGYVYVNTGLLAIADDDELACVLAHEVAHIAAKHSVKAMQAAFGFNLVTSLIFRTEESQSLQEAGSLVFNLVHLKYSREDETLADKLGVRYARDAGFDPRGMIRFFQALKEKQERDGTPQGILFLRSHPYVEQRIEAVKKEIDLITQSP